MLFLCALCALCASVVNKTLMNPSSKDYDCIVIGGGPSGSTTAALVADAAVADLVARLRAGLSEPPAASSLLAVVPDRLAAAS